MQAQQQLKVLKKKLTWSNIALLFSLYTTLFVGVGFFLESFIGILREQNVPLESLGLIYMLGLFFVFRFLWAPIIDKVHFKQMGHYRIWIIIFQVLMVMTLFLISIFNVIEDLKLIILLTTLFCFFAASQNVALDAFAFKITFKKQRPTINAIKVAGGLIGTILGGGVGLILYSNIYWHYTIFIMGIVTAIPLILLYFSSEPLVKHSNFIEKLDYGQFFSFWKTKEKKLWLMILLIYPATISAAFGMTTPLLVDLGWSLAKIGLIVHIVGYGIGFLASFGASYLINRFGKKNILVFSALGQSVGLLMLLLLFKYHDNNFLVMFVIGFIYMSYTPSQVLMGTLMMDLSSKKTPASQFAVQHSVSMFSGILFSSLAVSMSGYFGYKTIILICAFIGLCAIYLSTKIDTIIKKEKYERN